MRLSPSSVNEENLSSAWLETCRAVSGLPEWRAFHHVTRIAHPTVENPAIRQAIDELLSEYDLDPVETVSNTIFPAAMAKRCETPAQLAERYRRAYPRIKKFPGNDKGTYFGRIVAYPHGKNQQYDQLNRLLEKFQTERSTRGPMSARYEVSLECPESDALGTNDAGQVPVSVSAKEVTGTASIVVPINNTARMRFPCLSMCSFQLDGEHIHMVAHYRSHYLIQRAYGNYLGLGRILGYVARETGLAVGELMVVAGYAQIDSCERQRLRRLLRESSQVPP